MRKSLIVLAAFVPLLGLGGLAAVTLPALADSDENESCAVAPAGFVAGPIDLEAIPAQPVTGKFSVRGAGHDCDGEDDDDRGGLSRGDDRDDD